MNASAQAIRHALGWLVLANGVGLLLSLLLLFPSLGAWFGPLTYGRWYPIHSHGHLYGWCSLPLVALLFRLFPLGGRLDRWARDSVSLWSAALLAVCLWFLAGRNSGKLFTEFTLPALAPFLLALASLWAVLAVSSWFGRHQSGSLLRFFLVLGLAAVPFGLAWAASPGSFPPVNPRSGGATGHNLLASTLGLIPILVLLPRILGAEARPGLVCWRGLGIAYGLGWCAWLAVAHGHEPNDSISQIVSLFTLLPWAVLLPLHWFAYAWSAAEQAWLRWASAWWALLVVSGCVMFLPHVLDRLKFTNGLVAHTHLAMAGFLSCFLLVIVLRLGPGNIRAAAALPRLRLAWNVALGVHLAALALLGCLEAGHPGLVFLSSAPADTSYALRSLAGGFQLWVSLVWFRAGLVVS